MSFHVTYNFVQGYDLGQKKIVASEVDQNFSDIEGYINNSSVNISDPQTITGDKVFTGTVDLSGATVISSDNIPVGSIIWSANATVPAGYLLCNGASVGRDTYPELFAAIGTTYGEGDGSTTFNLPNLIGRFIEGASTAGTVKAAGLPNITGTVGDISSIFAGSSGAFNNMQAGRAAYPTSNAGDYIRFTFDASRSNPIYGASNTVQPPSVTALPCIKAFSAVIGDATVVAAELVDDIMARTDPAQAAHAAMPSNQHIYFTLPANGGTITAPGDGWVSLRMRHGAAGLFAYIESMGVFSKDIAVVSNETLEIHIPCSSGASVVVAYTMPTADASFYFTYANGSAPTV